MNDFAKWSGLTVAEAYGGLEAVKEQLQREIVDDQAYWFWPAGPASPGATPAAHLLSIYDEYISGYKDRSAIVDPATGAKLVALGSALGYIIVVDG